MSKFVREVDIGNDLTLSCYTKKAFYKKHWTEETIQARGHVRDKEGNLVSRPYDKIFNVGEHETSTLEYIWKQYQENEDVEFAMTEKFNGHLAILFYHDGQWINTTKGGNHPDIINRDRELIEQSPVKLDKKYTYMFEIMDHENDPHVMHMFEDKGSRAVLIGIRNTETGNYVDFGQFKRGQFHSFEQFKEWIEFLKEVKYTEGFVIYLMNKEGHAYNIFKVKTNWFLKMRYYWYGILNDVEKVKQLIFDYRDGKDLECDEEIFPVIKKMYEHFYQLSQEFEESFEEVVYKQKSFQSWIDYIANWEIN